MRATATVSAATDPGERATRLDVEHAVNHDGDVVARDGRLRLDGHRLLLQAPRVADAVHHGHQQVQARLEHSRELAKALDNHCRLLRADNEANVRRGAGAPEGDVGRPVQAA
jgi:hypothetical protein